MLRRRNLPVELRRVQHFVAGARTWTEIIEQARLCSALLRTKPANRTAAGHTARPLLHSRRHRRAMPGCKLRYHRALRPVPVSFALTVVTPSGCGDVQVARIGQGKVGPLVERSEDGVAGFATPGKFRLILVVGIKPEQLVLDQLSAGAESPAFAPVFGSVTGCSEMSACRRLEAPLTLVYRRERVQRSPVIVAIVEICLAVKLVRAALRDGVQIRRRQTGRIPRSRRPCSPGTPQMEICEVE